MQHDPTRPGRRREVDRFDVLVVGADIADVGEGEGDDLPGIGGIGEDLLIAGHRGVEADLADRVPGGAKALSFEHGAVSKDEERGRFGIDPAVMVRLSTAVAGKSGLKSGWGNPRLPKGGLGPVVLGPMAAARWVFPPSVLSV